MTPSVKKVNFKNTKGILQEIEDGVNEFKQDTERFQEVELRLRGCNHAIKIHMLEFMQEKLMEDKHKKKDQLSYAA
jgi:hypothetical protein